MSLSAQHTSLSQEWYTPWWLIDAAKLAMGGIDLDPASCHLANEQIVKAKMFFDRDMDGLRQYWGRPEAPSRIWLNPPYAQMSRWVEKLLEEQAAGHVLCACILAKPATDSRWCQQLLDTMAAACFFEGRIKFLRETAPGFLREGGSPAHGNVMFWLPPATATKEDRVYTFRREFKRFGKVVTL